MRATDYLSATALSKKTSATLDALARGDTEKLIILSFKCGERKELFIGHG